MSSEQTEMIRCQWCGKETDRTQWQGGGDICPCCGRKYDAIRAQDEEED